MNKKDQSGGMESRGVTRPMAEQEIRQHKAEKEEKEQKQDHKHQKGHGHTMPYEERLEQLHMHHKQTLWVYWMLLILGVWLVLAPFNFGYGQETVSPSGGRSVWLSLDARIAAMTWSDVISGLLLIFFGWRSLTPNRPVSMWICCLIGVWLNIAPVLFWAPTPAAYLNDTVVGTLVITLTILVPGMPNMIMYMKMGSEVPPGWSYNPSSWAQRWIMIVAGFAGWMVSRYLATFQLGFIENVWDPFFGEGSRLVLNSNMSHSLPVSDGAMGALAYTFEFLMGFMGSPSRWRTMPWMVAFFGILVIPLGLVHIFLVISQPVVVGHWCTFCLLAAAVMLPMIPLEIDEVIAMFQHMKQARRRGDNMWEVFWKGGEPIEHNMDERSPAMMELPQKPNTVFQASIWGMSFPWTLVVSSVLGIFLMAVPGMFDVIKPASNIYHLGGALIVVVSVISMGEVVRIGRYLNVLLGLIVAAVPWFMSGGSLLTQILGAIAGIIVIGLAFPKGPQKEHYGSWDQYVR